MPNTVIDGFRGISGLVQRFSNEIQDLGALNQAIQLLTSTVNNIVSPFTNAINASEQFNQQILQAQIAFNIATTEIDSFGNEIVSFADRLGNSKEVFSDLAKELEIETQTVVGLTSSRLNNVLNEVIQESAAILGQYSDKYGKNSIEIFKKLTANLASTYSLLGSPEYQDPQETRALLMGSVNDPNSFVAGKLNISTSEVSDAKSKGQFIDLLIEKTEGYRVASTLASDSLSNLTSNLQEISELIQRSFGDPLLKTFTKLGGEIFSSINSTRKNTVADLQKNTAKSVLAIDKDIERNREKLKFSTTETDTNEITRYINTLVKQREDIIKQSTDKLEGLGVDNPNAVATSLINESVGFEVREKIISSFESQNPRERTPVEGIVDYAKQFGTLLSELLTQTNLILNKIGDILINLNIDELLKGFSSGFLDGIKSTLNAASISINKVIGIITSLSGPLSDLVGIFVNFDTGNFLGYITGVGLSLKLLSDATGFVIKGYSLLFGQTVLLAGAMSRLIRSSFVLVGGSGIFSGIRSLFAPAAVFLTAQLGSLMRLVGPVFGSLAGAVAGALPMLVAGAAVLAAVYVGFLVLNKALNYLSVGNGPINKFAAALQKATNWILTFGGLFNGKKKQGDITTLKSNSINSVQKTIEDFREIGGKETFQKSLSRDGKVAKDIQETFVKTYGDINLLLNGTKEELRIAGKTEKEIREIITSRNDKEFVKELEEKRGELEEIYKDATGLELSGETSPLRTKSRDTFASVALSNLRAAQEYVTPAGIELRDENTKEVDIDNIQQSYELLSSNNLLGTDSLNNYAEMFLEITKNELLTAEQRNIFIGLYEKAIQKELEITQGFIKATESILKSRQKAGELSPYEYEFGGAELEVESAKAELESTTKTNLVKTAIRNEDNIKAENERRKIFSVSEQNIKKLPQLYEEVREKEEKLSKVRVLDDSIDSKLKETFGSEKTNSRGKKDGVRLDKKKFTQQNVLQFINSENLGNIPDIKEYLLTYSEIANSSANNDFIKKTNSGSAGDFGEKLINGQLNGYNLIIREFSDVLQKTSTFTSSSYSKEASNLALKFIQGTKINPDDYKALTKRQQDELGTLINNSLRDLSNTREFKNFDVNISGFSKKYRDQSETEIGDLKKQIEQLSVEIIIDADTSAISEKLKGLLSEREELKNKIESGIGTPEDLNKAKELDVEIIKEKTISARDKINNRIKNTNLEKKNIESEIATLSGKSTITQEDKSRIAELSKNLSEVTGEIKKDTTLKSVLDEREKLITEASEKRVKLSAISEQKKTANPKDLKELEREETLITNRLDKINRLVNTNKLSDIEDIKDRINGNKELNELSDAQIAAKSQELLSAQKLLSVEKAIKNEREEQFRLSLNLLDSKTSLIEAQLKSAGTFSPELFQDEIAQAEFDDQVNKFRSAENELRTSNKKLEQSFLQVGGENIKNLYEQISADEPLINESTFTNQVESLSKKSFIGFKEAYQFVEKSLQKNSAIDKILNATTLTEEVKKAYKDVFNQELTPNVNLGNIQEQLSRTKGALVLENNEALDIGNLASNLSVGNISFKEAINEAKALGINIDNIANSQELLIVLTQKYGEELGSQEIINSLSAQKESYIKLKEEQLKYITLLETVISKNVEYSLEISNRIRRESELADVISNIGGDTEDSTLRLNQAINSYESSVQEFNSRLKYENIENLQRILKEEGLEFNIGGLEKLSEVGGISKKVLDLAKNLQQVSNELESASFGRLDEIFSNRNQAINVLNTLGSINLGPNTDLSEAERSLLSLAEATDQAIAKLETKIDFQNIRKSIIGLKESGTSFVDVINDINNVANSLKSQMDGIANVAISRFSNSFESMSLQLGLLNSLQQAYNSLSNAQSIYSNVVNKSVQDETNVLQQNLGKVQINQDAAKKYEELKSSGKKDLNTQKQLEKLADSSGISERERIESKIENIKDKQLKIEKIQADTALKRQLIESKILELKNKQSRVELFSERAKIISQEDSPQKSIRLKANSRLLEINKLEGSLLSESTKLISDARNLQRKDTGFPESQSFGRPFSQFDSMSKSGSSLLGNVQRFSQKESKILDNLLSEVDKTAKGFGLSESESKNILDTLESQLKIVSDKASEVLPEDLIQGVTEINSGSLAEETNNILTKILETIKEFNIDKAGPATKEEEEETRVSVDKKGNLSRGGLGPGGKITNESKDNFIYEKDGQGNITKITNKKAIENPVFSPTNTVPEKVDGDYRVYTDERGMPVITNQKAVDNPLWGSDFSNQKPIESFGINIKEIGGASSGEMIRRIWGIDEEQIQREKFNRINVDTVANNYTVPEVKNSIDPGEITKSVPSLQDILGDKRKNSRGNSTFIKDEPGRESIIETGKSIIPKKEENLSNIESITNGISDALNSLVSSSSKGNIFSLESANNFFSNNNSQEKNNISINVTAPPNTGPLSPQPQPQPQSQSQPQQLANRQENNIINYNSIANSISNKGGDDNQQLVTILTSILNATNTQTSILSGAISGIRPVSAAVPAVPATVIPNTEFIIENNPISFIKNSGIDPEQITINNFNKSNV